MIRISVSLIWSKILMELIFNPCGEFRWSPEGPVSQIHSTHLHARVPAIFSDLIRSVQMLKREWGAESNGKLRHLLIPSKTVTLVPEFAVDDRPLGRIAALVSEFAVKDLPLGRTFRWLGLSPLSHHPFSLIILRSREGSPSVVDRHPCLSQTFIKGIRKALSKQC